MHCLTLRAGMRQHHRCGGKLGYTVSGVSRMMAALEAESGFPLLLRSRTGVAPTEDCMRMLPTFRELARLGALSFLRFLD